MAASGAALPGQDANANTLAATATLQRWYNDKGLWDTTGWWNAANCLEAIENAIEAGNGGPYLPVLANTFRLNSNRGFLNEFYDDEGWWALAWLRAFDLSGDPRYLKMAQAIFKDMTGGWTETCGGGLKWKKTSRYKNAIANELFLLVAIRLHQRTPGDAGPGSYRDWALKEWTWFKNSGMVNVQNLVNDGLDRNCQNNGRTTWTYNQGVIIGGLTDLYKITGDTNYLNQATAIADAATALLADADGILHEPCEESGCKGGDAPQFKGIFIRYLAYLYDVTRKPAYYDFLSRNACSVWRSARDSENHLGLNWSGPFDAADAARQSSALMAVSALAEPATASLPGVWGAGTGVFTHEVGASCGSLAWSCGPASATRPGYMQAGPFVSSLPAGAHAVHFRIAADKLDRSPSQLVRLEVREGIGAAMLASREVAWNEFVGENQPQDFSVSFTNPAVRPPLDFRVYWHHAPEAPTLTLTDVSVDGAHNWTAANLGHEVGRLDGHDAWAADPLRDCASGYLAAGPGTGEFSPGRYSARFELKVDNFNRDKARVATISVVELPAGKVVAASDLKRNQFRTTLYHTFSLDFRAAAGKRYDFRTYWHYSAGAPRLTLRSVVAAERSPRRPAR